MALALLKRSDEDLLLPVACDTPKTLASELSALQPFTVEVVAVWQAFAGPNIGGRHLIGEWATNDLYVVEEWSLSGRYEAVEWSMRGQ